MLLYTSCLLDQYSKLVGALLQELPGVTQLAAVKDSYVPVIKFQVPTCLACPYICLTCKSIWNNAEFVVWRWDL